LGFAKSEAGNQQNQIKDFSRSERSRAPDSLRGKHERPSSKPGVAIYWNNVCIRAAIA